MKKLALTLIMLPLCLALVFWSACKKDLTVPGLGNPPCDTCLVDGTNEAENEKLENHLQQQVAPVQPPPNQYELLNESETATDSIKCTERVISETSPEHSELLLPNPTDIYVPGWVYQLPSIMLGGDEPIVVGLGGNRYLTLRAGAYSDTIKTEAQSHAILSGITTLQQRLPPHAQNVDIIVEEVFSARQAAVRFKAAYNGTFYDFAASADYSSQEYKHKYMAVLRVHDFDIDVSIPTHPRDWFPHLDSTQYGIFGSYAPVYVDKISYGKYMMMLVETNMSKINLQTAVSASFGGVFSGGQFDASGEYSRLKTSSRITIKAIGGDADAATALLSGEPNAVKNYLERIAQDKSGAKAAPLFAQFRFLKDNSRAKIVLATDAYKVRDCQLIPAQSMVYESNQYFTYKTNQTGGDNDFGGDGYPYVFGKIFLEVRNESEVWLVNKTDFYELRDDYTTGEAVNEQNGQKDVLLLKTPAGKRVVNILTSTLYNIEYNDHNHSVDLFPEIGEFDSGILIKKLFINGDTDGDDVPSSGINTDRAWMKFSLNRVVVEIR